jgi:Fur family peroxide stress response transcriptional regulator
MLTDESAYVRLRGAGLRLTPQRRAVIGLLSTDRSHPTADEVASRLTGQLPGMSLSTVYKVLHELAELGLVREIDLPGAKRFDAEAEDHVHIVCEGCGSITDAALPPRAVSAIAEAVEDIGASTKRIDVLVRAVCESCSD